MIKLLTNCKSDSEYNHEGLICTGKEIRIIDELKADILITPKVNLVEPRSLPSTEGKAVRLIDNRKE